jgi:hypothetical protein
MKHRGEEGWKTDGGMSVWKEEGERGRWERRVGQGGRIRLLSFVEM